MIPNRSRALEVAALFAAAVTLALATALPIYVDETNWQMLRGRLLLDGGVTIHFNYPSCGLPFASAPPWYFLPFRLLNAAIYVGVETPSRLRMTGIATAFALYGLLLYLLARLPEPAHLRRRAALVAAFATMGVLPLLLVLDRPEPLLVAGGAILLLLPLGAARHGASALRLPVVLACAVGMLSVHPKALFFLPLMVAAAWLTAPGRRVAIATIPLLVVAAIGSYGDWSARMACPGDSHVRTILEQHSLSPALLANPIGLLGEVWRNQTGQHHPLGYATAILFRDRYMSDWLPPGTRPAILGPLANVLVLAALAAGAMALVISLAILVLRAWRQWPWRRWAIEPTAVLVLSLIASLAALNVFQVIKNDYEASLVLPLAGLATIAALSSIAASLPTKALVRAGNAILIVSLVSQAALWASFLPQAFGPWSQGGYLPAQRHSVASLGNARVLADAEQVARQCAIRTDATARHLVLDPLTYPVFAHTREPFLISYLSGGWGQGIADLPAFLAERRSAGVVAACHALPPTLRARARAVGDICCVDPLAP